ncbi:MAG: tetratricopeptide repeat protein [Terriglobales bacterium]
MGHFRLKARHYSLRLVVFAELLLLPLVALAQSPAPPNSATVHGFVRDSRGLPVPAASVHLQRQGALQVVTVVTDSKGAYRSAGLREGAYTLRAEKTGAGEVSVGPLDLGERQVREIDLTLVAPVVRQGQSTSAGTPEFFDEPQFTVAGVTDATNHGGHGSDTVSRTTQSLAKDIVALDKDSPSVARSAPNVAKERSLREAAARDPGSFEVNQQLGILLARGGRTREALPYLEQAHRSRPDDYESAYALAQAYMDLGKYDQASATALSLLAKQDQAALHHLLGDLEEKRKNPLQAVHEYQHAAELDPSEPNLFDWGTELLTHRALEPALEVFTQGSRLFPQSARMLVGRGVAWYASGSPELAAKYLCQASDLNPADPNPYLVLGKMQIVDTSESQAVLARLERFARLQPDSAPANYYYALGLWRRRKSSENRDSRLQVESLLENAVRLDPKLAPAFLQLGVLYEEQADLPKAIPAYQKAIAADPQLSEAHYRLARAYRRTGDQSKAAEEIKLYDQISKKSAEQVEREAREIPQFVYTLRDSKSPARSQ